MVLKGKCDFDAFTFSCVRCGACCAGVEDSASVVLYEDDVTRLSENLGMKVSTFVREYGALYRYIYDFLDGRQVALRLVLKRNGRCPFLNAHECVVHPFKPYQCRAAPFINPIVSVRREFQRFANKCAGLGKGDTVPSSVVVARLKEQYMREVEWFSEADSTDSRVYQWLHERPHDKDITVRVPYTINLYSELLWSHILNSDNPEGVKTR